MDSSETGRPHIVLVVDDDPSDLALMEQALSRAGYAVETASNYQQALSILQKITPTVLVFDVAMPGMSGFELYSALKDDDRLRKIPVVFVSGCDSEEISRIGNVVGGAFFVRKAEGWDNLLSAVSLICGSRGTATHRYDSARTARVREKRLAPRYVLKASVAITDPISRKQIMGLASDISATGCQMQVSSSLPPRSLVKLCIAWNNQTFETFATIIRVQPQGMGVAFRETPPANVVILASWIRRLSAEQRSEH